MKRNLRPLVFSLLLVLATVAVTAGITVAWVARNRQAQSDNMTMQIQAKNLRIHQYQVYQCDESERSAAVPAYQVAQKAGSAEEGYRYTMKEYDSIFTDTNVYHGLMIAVELFSFPEGTKSIRATLSCSGTDKDADVTSNIIYWGYTKAENDFSFDPAPNEALHTARRTIQAQENNVRFLSLDGTKNTQAQLIIPLTEAEKSADKITLLFLLDYDSALVAAQNIDPFTLITDDSQDGSLLGATTVFKNDLTTLVFTPVID